jgi:hypothetical protein
MMKLLALLATLSFASLPPVADSQDAYYGYGGDPGPYDPVYGGYSYGLPAVEPPYGTAQGPRQGTARDDPPRGARGDERLWVPAPEYPPLDPYEMDFAAPHAGPGLYERLQSPGSPARAPVSYGAGRPSQVDAYAPPDRPMYRFRQPDGLAGGAGGAGGSEVWHRGFRFRPLTEQERERATVAPGWRPSSPGYRREAPVSPARGAAPPPDEAFGYQPDSWFQRYYGERY